MSLSYKREEHESLTVWTLPTVVNSIDLWSPIWILPQGKFAVANYAMIDSYYADTHNECKMTMKSAQQKLMNYSWRLYRDDHHNNFY